MYVVDAKEAVLIRSAIRGSRKAVVMIVSTICIMYVYIT